MKFWDKVDKTDSCWLWTGGTSRAGYGYHRLDGAVQGAHRISARLAGMDVDGKLVLHRCDTPACVNPEHLFLGTHADNTADMVAKDRAPRGARAPSAKLTQAQVDEIRARHRRGESQSALAREHNVHPATVCKLVNRRSW